LDSTFTVVIFDPGSVRDRPPELSEGALGAPEKFLHVLRGNDIKEENEASVAVVKGLETRLQEHSTQFFEKT